MEVGIGLNRLFVQLYSAIDVTLLMSVASVLKQPRPVGAGLRGSGV